MKYAKSVVKMVFLALCAISVLAVSADAASVTVRNSLDKKLSLAFFYTDKSGGEVTKGWWYVEPGAEAVVTLDADDSKPVYYAAFNKDLYSDASTAKEAQVRGWLSYKMFTFDADVEPDDADVFESKFFRCPEGGAVDINADSRGRRI
jgi:uncharacterized membrane protein